MPEPIAAPADPRALAAELACLPEARRMSSTRGMEVRLVRWGEAPSVMHELGRLREQTFRAAGEGTGRALDLDPFDRWYDHLVLWEPERCAVLDAVFNHGPVEARDFPEDFATIFDP